MDRLSCRDLARYVVPLAGLTLAGCSYDFDATVQCSNGVQDGTEVRIDCGGDCPACFGEPCAATTDCKEGTCDLGRCNPPPSKTRRAWQTFAAPNTTPVSRYGAALAPLDAEGAGLVLRGGSAGGDIKDDTWVLEDLKWTSQPTAPPKAYMGMVHRGDAGGPIAVGGQSDTGVTADVATWDNDAKEWIAGGPTLPEPRMKFAIAHDDHLGRTFVFGGIPGDLSGSPSSDLLVLDDGSEGGWEPITHSGSDWPGGRYDHAMAFDPRAALLVVFGGRTASKVGTELDDTWLFDGSSFLRLDGFGPSKRRGHVMVYDEDAGRIVLFGGSDGDALSDTWEFDAETRTWIEMHFSVAPQVAKGWGSAMAYERARHRAVLFGGQTQSEAIYSYVVFGNACAAGEDCGAGICADGVCCETECDAGACNTTDNPGVCVQ